MIMRSMIVSGVSLLLSFAIFCFMWLIGSNIVYQFIAALPTTTNPEWAIIAEQNKSNIKLIITFLPSIILVFASIIIFLNALRNR